MRVFTVPLTPRPVSSNRDVVRLVDEAVRAFNMCMLRLAQSRPTEVMELPSLGGYYEKVGAERWVTVTQVSVTPVDEQFIRGLLVMVSALRSLYALAQRIPPAAPETASSFGLTEVVNSTYAMGMASLRTILLHVTATSVMLPASFVASELVNGMAAISSLASMVLSLPPPETVAQLEVT